VELIRNPRDFWAGVISTGTGVVAMVYGSRYPLGSAGEMGPGYFPRVLAIVMIGLGLILIARGIRTQGPRVDGWKWRPIVIVIGSIVLFGAIVQSLGLALSTVILIFGSSLASHEFRFRAALLAGIALAALAVGVFVIGLKLQLPIWPTFLQ
jgi:hypothetical protein